MRLTILTVLGLLLAGCGVDGDPERPAAKTGVSVTGEAWIGASWIGN